MRKSGWGTPRRSFSISAEPADALPSPRRRAYFVRVEHETANPEDAPRDDAAPSNADTRWSFLRDVAVFQGKMALDNMRDLVLMPASLVAAGLDIVFKGETEGQRFYKVLNWGRQSEEIINVYGAVCETDPDDETLRKEYSVDAIVARLEGVIVREYEKGGTAASMKRAVDNAIDQLQREANGHGVRAGDALRAAIRRMNIRAGAARADGAAPQPDGLREDDEARI